MSKTISTLFLSVFLILIFSCNDTTRTEDPTNLNSGGESMNTLAKPQSLSKEFKSYWYANEAEITSYRLEQARYGEMREGTAVLVYVTEPFLEDEQVKADNPTSSNIPVLKLNAVKNFNTGIYPYSIMQSIFYPVANNQHALKISCSVQEWCGHVYMQLNNHDEFNVMSHSYFEGEADEDFNLEKSILENELWTQLRLDPKSLPIGTLQLIPAFEFLRLRHIPFKTYEANLTLQDGMYQIDYPELDRTLKIQFDTQFPYGILGWEETFISGFGEKARKLTTKASKIETLKSAYWNKNGNTDSILRDSLGIN